VILTDHVVLKIEIKLIVSFIFKKELHTLKLSNSKNLHRRFPTPRLNASNVVRKGSKIALFPTIEG